MSFDVAAESYTRFMGVFAEPLAVHFADFAGVGSGQRVVDVGCGPGALTAELVRRCGADAVRAIDPSEPFVEACRSRLPGVEVSRGGAERLPYGDAEFDVATAQLVVPFMADPDAGLREMSRVTRPGGVVAICAWDHVGGHGPLSPLWAGVHDLDPDGPVETSPVADREAALPSYVEHAGLTNVTLERLTVDVTFTSIDEWWEPLTFGVGPAGDFVAGLSEERRGQVREACAARLGPAPFTISATARAVRGIVSPS